MADSHSGIPGISEQRLKMQHISIWGHPEEMAWRIVRLVSYDYEVMPQRCEWAARSHILLSHQKSSQ